MWENYVYSFTHRFTMQVSSWCTGIGVVFGHFLCPLSRDFNHKVCPKLWSHYPQNAIFYELELFSSPKGQEFDQKIAKKKKERRGKSNATTMPMSPPCSIQTLIPTLMGRCYAFNLWALRQKTAQCVMEIKKFKVSKKTRQFYDSLVSPVMLMLLYSEKNTAFSSIPKREILLEKPHRWLSQIQLEPYSLELQVSKISLCVDVSYIFPIPKP